MLKQIRVQERALCEGGTLAAEVKPGDLIRTALGNFALKCATPFKSEGTDMIRLEFFGGTFDMMPATCQINRVPA